MKTPGGKALEFKPHFTIPTKPDTVGVFHGIPIISADTPPCPACSSKSTIELRSEIDRVLGCLDCGHICKVKLHSP